MPFLVYLVFNVCYCSPKTELLGTVTGLLNDCSRFYPYADHNMAENLIVRRLSDALVSGAQVKVLNCW